MKKIKIFIAVDTKKIIKAKNIISQSQTDKIRIGYKFGLEFMNSKNGRKFVSNLKNKVIFLDLKLNDTVHTMVSTIKALKDLKIHYLTVHISSGLKALKAVKNISGSIKIIGVTTLTSLNDYDLKLLGYNKSVKDLVSHQAKIASRANLDAVVCSAFEVDTVKKVFKKEIIIPGIKLGKKNYDQKRSMEAKKVKADWLVIGRAITRGNIKKNLSKLVQDLR